MLLKLSNEVILNNKQKKYMIMKAIKHLFAALLLLCSVAVNAHSFEVDGIYYNITSEENKTVAVTYQGSSYSQYSNEYSGAVVIPESVTYNGTTYSVTSIGSSAFDACSGLTSITIPNSVTSIGSYAFDDCRLDYIYMRGNTPPTIVSNSFYVDRTAVIVPDAAVNNYRAADVWSGFAIRIVSDAKCNVDINVTAKSNSSDVLETIGLDDVINVVKLKITGSINSYDIIQFRDKMPNLKVLDISNVTVVASSKAFYESNCTGDNDLGNYAFYGLNLAEVKLPKGIVRIGDYLLGDCSSLKSVDIPSSVKSFGSYAFRYCPLENVKLPDGLETIGYSAFSGCSKLKEIKFPPTVKTIGSYAFNSCSSLEEVRIPSSVTSIGNYAFSSCSKLQKVYTYVIEPTSISENTFSTFETATLYIPSFSFWNYYWDEGWKRFLNLEKFNEPYEYFYINNDYVLNDDTGYIEGVGGNAPDADINTGGGLVVEGEQGDDEDPKQNLGDVNVEHDGAGNGGSIIGDNNLHIDNLHIRINVRGGRWYFFAFPFDIKFRDIYMQNGSDYVFRYYDGEERAKKGNGGWKDVNEDHLKAARGYIFQCSANDVLVLSIKDVKFKKEDKYNELVAHVSENLKDASWNYVGNPYLSYYDMADMDYSAPVTVWDGSKYVAIRPGDDDYCFAPYEAFFVQKPEGQSSIGFDGNLQMTGNQAKDKQNQQNAASKATRGMAPERYLVNVVISDGEANDRTRVVFNEKQSLAYETSCDASKFETKGVLQIYTIGNDNVHYAINERPVDNGRVVVGYSVPTSGLFTIEAERMDVQVVLVDTKNGVTHDFNDGAYVFSSEAGTFNERFEIKLNGVIGGTTGIEEVESDDAVETVYDLLGRKVKNAVKGIYIVDGEKVVK